MALFRRRAPEIVRKGDAEGGVVVERKTKRLGRQVVEVRRVREPEAPAKPDQAPKKSRQKQKPSGRAKGRAPSGPTRTRARTTIPEEQYVPAPETARKQMLVRVLPQQTQIVVLEGPVLVEHYVTRSDKSSLVGNIYLGKVRNVLPGMEAAFVDFGEPKNGVLYAGDVAVDREKFGKRRPRIEEVLSEGDDVLVQVAKDAMGHKGARLTGQVSLPGRNLVLVPDSDAQGISRRLPDEDRDRLRDVIRAVKPEGYGVIVRTASVGASEEDIRVDIERLVAAWERVKEDASHGSGPRVVYEEPSLLIRVIREHFTPDFRRLLIDDVEAHRVVTEYLGQTDESLLAKVSLYTDELALFERFHVEDQLLKALDRKVWLKSGGHLVIDRTEALTVVDVNTGKYVGSSSLEETVLQNNLEAAEEVGRQLRLRDIGGIIVIDFIDMEDAKNRQAVLRKLRETLAKDKTRTQVFDVSNLGLVEMTRKNVSDGLLEHFSDLCQTCNGRGVVLHADAALGTAPAEAEAEVAAEA